MSALLRDPSPRLVPITLGRVAEVAAAEAAAYEFPWTRGNFIDSLSAGYLAMMLLDANDRLIGYFIAMNGVEEMHLLNITVAQAHRGRGHAIAMLDALLDMARERGARKVWLEVRESNAHARAIYLRYGFTQIGVRRGYYPATQGKREDAAVMGYDLQERRDGVE
jgi:ribosomal-protein-alanine N-acetyltransferase